MEIEHEKGMETKILTQIMHKDAYQWGPKNELLLMEFCWVLSCFNSMPPMNW